MELDRGVQSYLRTGVWRGRDQENPVVVEKGTTYVRHNGVRIGNAQDASGGMFLHFLWNLQPVAWVRFYGAKRATEQFEYMNVPEGRHRVEAGISNQSA